jgi:putative aldouronate transport system substrate-binding protein
LYTFSLLYIKNINRGVEKAKMQKQKNFTYLNSVKEERIMSRKSTRIAVLLICCMLLVSVFTGCQTTPGSQQSPSPTTAPEATQAPQAELETPSNKLSDKLVTITAMRDENPAQPFRENTPVLQYIEEELNVKLVIEAVPKANYVDKKKILITTNNLPDIVYVAQQDLVDYSKSGVFLNLSDNMDDMPNFKALIEGPYSDLQKLKVNGSFFGTPTLCRWQTRSGAVALIRVDLLEENNLEIPTTFEELYDALKVFKEKYPDKIPFTNRKGGSVSGTEKVLEAMSYTLGSGFSSNLYPYYDPDVDGGKYLVGPANPQFKEVLGYLNRLYTAGLLDPDYATNTADQWKEKMSSGRALSYFDNAGFGQDFNIALSEIEPDAALLPIYTMTNSLGQTRNTFYDKNWPNSSFAISSKSKVADTAVKLLDWYYSEEGCDVAGFGIEGETFEYVDGKPRIFESVLKQYLNANSPSYEIQSSLGIGYLSFTPYVDAGAEFQMKEYTLASSDNKSLERYLDAYNSIEFDPNMDELVIDPPFTSEEAQRIKEIVSVMQNIFKPEYDKYITGVTPMSEYDGLIEKARAAGAEELEKIYNDANARIK